MDKIVGLLVATIPGGETGLLLCPSLEFIMYGSGLEVKTDRLLLARQEIHKYIYVNPIYLYM